MNLRTTNYDPISAGHGPEGKTIHNGSDDGSDQLHANTEKIV
jgi:hypothetical protein